MNASAILTADWHLRDDTPTCRTDDYWQAQERKIEFINALQDQNNGCPVLVAGDLFDTPEPSAYLLQWALRHLPDCLFVTPGQHDLPSHSIELVNRSGLAVLQAADAACIGGAEVGDVFRVTAFPWGARLEGVGNTPFDGMRPVAMIHTLVQAPDEKLPNADTAGRIFKQMPGFVLIVSGDNHKPFVYKTKEGRLLVNPGSLMRASADQAEHRPRVYLWYAEKNDVKPAYIPIEKGVVSRRHIDDRVEKDSRIAAYVSKLTVPGASDTFEGVVSFERNLEKHMRMNKTQPEVKKAVYRAMEKEGQ